MDFRHLIAPAGGLSGVATDALLVVLQGDKLDPALDPAVAAAVKDAQALGDFELKAGRVWSTTRPAGLKAARLTIVQAANAGLKALRNAVAAGFGQLKSGGAKQVVVALARPDAVTEQLAQLIAATAADAVYLYRDTKPSAPPAPALSKVAVLCTKADARAVQRGLARGAAVAAGVEFAKSLANLPGNHCTPTYLADQARMLGKSHGLKVDVLDRRQLEKLGMGAFLAVAQGSAQPPRFIVARYEGAARTQAPVVLVGKGITFDSGGISIKPSAEMDEMKFDMGGAASVLGTLRAIAEIKPHLNLVCLVPTCENLPSGTAIKPGDVVTSLSGQTIEILNTDAEGRLILCDALAYAERFKPSVVVDVATLTGACVIALGHHNSGLFTADDALAEQLLAAGREALDPLWRMPLEDEYDEALKSNFADMANVGPRAAGAITAAMFLRRFTGKYRWAHLDIAGTAWKSGAQKGSTGRPVPALTQFVLSQQG